VSSEYLSTTIFLFLSASLSSVRCTIFSKA
jgi:hypothetical protein